ncbi:MAG: helix-turn-helix domain-containing protein [Lactococcus lactis]
MENKVYTIKEIADELNINKQKISRFLKSKKIEHVSKKGQTLLFDENARIAVLDFFTDSSDENNKTLIAQIKEKDKQITDLTELLRNQQILTLHIQQENSEMKSKLSQIETVSDTDEEKYVKNKIGFWKRIFKK